jgi:hypothetical protein
MGGEMQSNPDRFWASVQAGSGQSGNGSNGWFKTDWAGNSPNDFFVFTITVQMIFLLFFYIYWAFFLITAQNSFFLFFGQTTVKI